MTIEEVAWEFVGVFDDLTIPQINEMLAKNVPLDVLKFFSRYGDEFGARHGLSTEEMRSLPNLLVIGYLLRVLEERLVIEDSDQGS